MSLATIITLVIAGVAALAAVFGIGRASKSIRGKRLSREGELAIREALERNDLKIEERRHEIESLPNPDDMHAAARDYGREVLARRESRLKRRRDD